MKKGATSKINSVLSIAVKILLVVLISYKLIPFLFGNEQELSENDQPQDELKEETISSLQDSIVHKGLEDPLKATFRTIETTILYQGKPLEGAYFTISNCPECISTTTQKDGRSRVRVPNSIYNTPIEYDFFVYQSDSLLYKRSLKFNNLQLNKY